MAERRRARYGRGLISVRSEAGLRQPSARRRQQQWPTAAGGHTLGRIPRTPSLDSQSLWIQSPS